MENTKEIIERLDKLTQEINQIKKILILQAAKPDPDPETKEAWKRLQEESEEISTLWKGPSAVEEIRAQREK